MCSAGHLPPIIANRGVDAQLLSIAQTPPLGVLAEIDPLARRCPVQDGTTIVLYTDGLVERRGELITDGLERLRSVIRSESPERLCGQIMDALIGQYVPDDDVALLALQVNLETAMQEQAPVAHSASVSVARSDLFPCHPASVKAARHFVDECVSCWGFAPFPTCNSWSRNWRPMPSCTPAPDSMSPSNGWMRELCASRCETLAPGFRSTSVVVSRPRMVVVSKLWTSSPRRGGWITDQLATANRPGLSSRQATPLPASRIIHEQMGRSFHGQSALRPVFATGQIRQLLP